MRCKRCNVKESRLTDFTLITCSRNGCLAQSWLFAALQAMMLFAGVGALNSGIIHEMGDANQ
jgi:hypothetical protein